MEYDKFDRVVNKIRIFFKEKGFIEVYCQDKLSTLVACENPADMITYEYNDQIWPMSQTTLFCLDNFLMQNPQENGFFCISTSYQKRHNFPIFEYEMKGNIDDLRQLNTDLLNSLGFNPNNILYPRENYDNICNRYEVNQLENEHKYTINQDYGPVFFLENFPERTTPMWDIKLNDLRTHSNKIDIILHGIDTISSSEKSCNIFEMNENFHTFSGGGYSELLYEKLGKNRVENDLNDFLNNDFIPRASGRILITQMIQAMTLSNLL
jgi:aspartyl/asparaginyl-tRNA synthetase